MQEKLNLKGQIGMDYLLFVNKPKNGSIVILFAQNKSWAGRRFQGRSQS